MAYPAGISLATVTVGSATGFLGQDAEITVSVAPVLGGNAKHVVHQATGHMLVAMSETFTGAAGEGVTFKVPHVDQAGFIDGSGNAFTMWSYLVTTTVRINGVNHLLRKAFQPLVSQTGTIDLDLVPDGTVGEPSSSPIPAVLSVNGGTGDVVLLEASDANVANQVNGGALTKSALDTATTGLMQDPASALATEVSATYASVFAVDPKYGDGVKDATAHIQSRINAAVSAGGGTIYFPRGRYRASGLTGSGTLTFRGAGGVDHRGGTRATSRAGSALMPFTAGQPIITLPTTLRLGWRDLDFVHDRSFKADAMVLGDTATGGSGTFWPDLNVVFSGFDGHALKIQGTFWECDLSNVHTRRCGDGENDKAAVEIDGTATIKDGDTVRFSAPNVTFPRAVGFRMRSSTNASSITGPGFRRLMLSGGMFHAGLDEDNVTLANRYPADMIVVDGFTSFQCKDVNVASTAAGKYALRLDGSLTTEGSNRALVSGNQFNGPIGVYKCKDVTIGRNDWAFWSSTDYPEHIYVDAAAVRTIIEPQTVLNDGQLVVTDNSPTTQKPTSEAVLLPATEFNASTGAPTLSRAASRFPAWLLDSATTEQVNATAVIPPGWRRFHVEVLWSNLGPGAGDVRWSLGYSARVAGELLSAGDVFPPAVTLTAPAADALAVSTFTGTAVTAKAGALYHFRISRTGADAADTLANDASFLGLRLRRAA